jgi:hypothetical protein
MKNKYKSKMSEKKGKNCKQTIHIIDFPHKKSKNHLFLFLNLHKYLPAKSNNFLTSIFIYKNHFLFISTYLSFKHINK